MSKYPIGATWEAFDEQTRRLGTIWLDDIKETFEVWKWCCSYRDGSGSKFDWSTSYQKCRKEIPMYNCKFKRVK